MQVPVRSQCVSELETGKLLLVSRYSFVTRETLTNLSAVPYLLVDVFSDVGCVVQYLWSLLEVITDNGFTQCKCRLREMLVPCRWIGPSH